MDDGQEDEIVAEPTSDRHSGSRLVLWAWTFALPPIAAVGAFYVVSDITRHFLTWDGSLRAGYAAAGATLLFTAVILLTWISRLKPTGDEEEDLVDDEMPIEDEEGWNDED